jgi:hypothetical protein
LGEAQLASHLGDAASQIFDCFAHVPTHFADAPVGRA